MTVYYTPNQIHDDALASILAIGDSWFWYPKASNLLAQLSAVVKCDYSNIMALGYVGAKLGEYVDGRFSKAVEWELRPGNLQYYSAVLISGGGNDVVDWGLCLKPACSTFTSPSDCIDPIGLTVRMGELAAWVSALVTKIHAAYDANGLHRPDIFVHSYDYAPPNGKGFSSLMGPWLKPALDRSCVAADWELRKSVVRLFIDRLAATLTSIPGVYVIQSQGTLDVDTDWDNELHPTGEGFRKIVHGPWLDMLRARGYA